MDRRRQAPTAPFERPRRATRAQTRAIEATAQLVQEAKDELEHHQSGENEMRSQIESATTSGEKLGLPIDIEAAGDLVTQLRHRQALEQKIAAAHGEAEAMQQQAEDLVDEQVVPIELFVFLGILFILGVMSVAAWWFLPASLTGGYSGWVALGGVGAAVIAAMIKFLTETSASDRFDACHYQIDTLLEKVDALEAEQAELDHALKLNGGSVGLRLQHAERHLAELERVMPVESQHREVKQAVSTADRRLKQAEEKYAAATNAWKSRLRAMGLPETVTPQNLAIMAAQSERLAELETRIENRRTEMQLRQREFNLVSNRIFTLAEECGLRLPGSGHPVAGLSEAGSSHTEEAKPRKQSASQPAAQTSATVHPLQQLDHIRGEHNKHTQRVEQRQSIRDRAKALKIEAVKHHHAAIGHRRRREALFQKSGVADEQELRALATKLKEAEELRAKRAATTREITAAIGKHGVEADFAPFLAEDQIGRLEHDWEALSTQSEELDRILKDALQRRGAMIEQQRTAAGEQSLAKKQVELDVVELQIKKAIDAWRERAAVSLFLERIRHEYEKHRQPETLREASEYMKKLTDGKYTRIWTPLSHDILFVDNAEGQSLSVQVLSRGTREQLFVSLRLALVAAYARRGIHLPMVLDDVFVNYDAGRTRTACDVLRQFAKQGHQLLVFTCHEHVWQMFKDINVDTRRIPNRHGELVEELPEAPQPELLPAPGSRTSRSRRRSPPRTARTRTRTNRRIGKSKEVAPQTAPGRRARAHHRRTRRRSLLRRASPHRATPTRRHRNRILVGHPRRPHHQRQTPLRRALPHRLAPRTRNPRPLVVPTPP